MIYSIYTIRDDKTGFLAPFVDQNDESAIRGFGLAVKNGLNDLMGFAPGDFRLYFVGAFDTNSGIIKSCDPRYLASAIDFKEVLSREKS